MGFPFLGDATFAAVSPCVVLVELLFRGPELSHLHAGLFSVDATAVDGFARPRCHQSLGIHQMMEALHP